jgi:hypothetical protein
MAVKDHRQLTIEERAQRRERDREYARQAVEALRSSQGWQAWLTTRASFHNYSLGNQLLIAMQRTASHCLLGRERMDIRSSGCCERPRGLGSVRG